MSSFSQRMMAWILRKFFHLLYHQFAGSYDLVSFIVSVGMWKDWVLSLLPDLDGQRILEIGHGPGHLQIALLNDSKQAVGIDLSPEMGKLGLKNIMNAGMSPHLVNGRGEALPFPNSSFDQIAATFPSEYIFFEDSLEEMYRVLEPNGEFFIIPVAWITGKRLFHRLAAWLFRITGESPDHDTIQLDGMISRLNELGLKSEIEIRKLANSKVLILRGRKTD